MSPIHLCSLFQTSAYYDPSSQFGSGGGSALSNSRQQQDNNSSSYSDSSKFGQATDSTSSPVPSTIAAQPTPFNALGRCFVKTIFRYPYPADYRLFMYLTITTSVYNSRLLHTSDVKTQGL